MCGYERVKGEQRGNGMVHKIPHVGMKELKGNKEGNGMVHKIPHVSMKELKESGNESAPQALSIGMKQNKTKKTYFLLTTNMCSSKHNHVPSTPYQWHPQPRWEVQHLMFNKPAFFLLLFTGKKQANRAAPESPHLKRITIQITDYLRHPIS